MTFFSNYTGPTYGRLFAGVISDSTFTSVTFSGTAAGDGIYFDRMQIADEAAPEPGGYAPMLVGLGLLGWVGRRSEQPAA
jgi:hypothetical protein